MSYSYPRTHSKKRVASQVDAYLASHDVQDDQHYGSEADDALEGYPPRPPVIVVNPNPYYPPPYPPAGFAPFLPPAAYSPVTHQPAPGPLADLNDAYDQAQVAAFETGRAAGRYEFLNELYQEELAAAFEALSVSYRHPAADGSGDGYYLYPQSPIVAPAAYPGGAYGGHYYPPAEAVYAQSQDGAYYGGQSPRARTVSINPTPTAWVNPPPTPQTSFGYGPPTLQPGSPLPSTPSDYGPSIPPSAIPRSHRTRRTSTAPGSPVAGGTATTQKTPSSRRPSNRQRTSSVAERPSSPPEPRHSSSRRTPHAPSEPIPPSVVSVQKTPAAGPSESRQQPRHRHPTTTSEVRQPAISPAYKPATSSETRQPAATSTHKPPTTPYAPVTPAADPQASGAVATQIVIKDILEEILASVPLRLFNTKDGKMYTQKELIATFWTSEQCKALLLLTNPHLAQQQTSYIKEVVRKYFEYAMLSHRWEDEEPVYKDIKSDIYSMKEPTGIKKLQSFCRTAEALGYQWAWSDTCCIDKKSSADLEESIASMFLWYRNSAITIVYLSDVASSSPNALRRSLWFTRGWTLQELLAPRVVQFYKADWTPFIEGQCFDHKSIDSILDILENATGVDRKFILNFNPGVDNARARLRWAYNRKTAKEEDIAYSLMGIFDIQIPVVYGEKAKAFGRLLMEIVGRSGDVTLFDWVGQGSRLNSCLPAHPSCYYNTAWTPEAVRVGRALSPLDDHDHRYLKSFQSLYQLLVDPPPVRLYFTQGKLTVNCIAYKVESLKFHYELARTPGMLRYDIIAEGLQPLHISTSETLAEAPDEEGEDSAPSACKYTLARVWHPDVLEDVRERGSRGMSDPPSAFRQLAKPFLVLLLMRRGNGPYRRVSTKAPIVAQLENPEDMESINPNISPLEIS